MSTEIKPAPVEQKLQLENLLPDSCALTPSQFAICIFWCLAFLFFCYIPVSGSATWQCVNEASFHTAAEKSVVLPLSEGIRSIPIGQSGKQFLAMLFQAGGARFLGLGFAILQLISFGLWTYVLHRICASSISLAAGAAIAIACFFQLEGIHTEIFGHICAALLALHLLSQTNSNQQLTWKNASRFQWLAVVLTMVLWVNLDATFILGLGGLAILAVVQFFKTKPTSITNVSASFSDPEFHHRVWLFEVGFLATILTPQGIGLWKSMLWWPDNPILAELGPELPALLASWSTLVIAVSWGIWMCVALQTQQKHSVTFTLLAIVASVMVCLNHELIFWFAVVMAMAIIELVSKANPRDDSAASDAKSGSEINPTSSSFKFAFTLLSGLVIWVAFCFSPFGSMVLGGSQRTTADIVGATLPVNGKQFVRDHETQLMHSPIYWSDWLSAGSDQPMMVSRGLHHTPQTANNDYQHIYAGGADWRKIADKYELTGLFIDKTRQSRLIRNLRRRPGQWRNMYEDSQCVVYQRSL